MEVDNAKFASVMNSKTKNDANGGTYIVISNRWVDLLQF